MIVEVVVIVVGVEIVGSSIIGVVVGVAINEYC